MIHRIALEIHRIALEIQRDCAVELRISAHSLANKQCLGAETKEKIDALGRNESCIFAMAHIAVLNSLAYPAAFRLRPKKQATILGRVPWDNRVIEIEQER